LGSLPTFLLPSTTTAEGGLVQPRQGAVLPLARFKDPCRLRACPQYARNPSSHPKAHLPILPKSELSPTNDPCPLICPVQLRLRRPERSAGGQGRRGAERRWTLGEVSEDQPCWHVMHCMLQSLLQSTPAHWVGHLIIRRFPTAEGKGETDGRPQRTKKRTEMGRRIDEANKAGRTRTMKRPRGRADPEGAPQEQPGRAAVRSRGVCPCQSDLPPASLLNRRAPSC
jgi:hypothetical protein